MMASLDRDTVFIALTRPQMFAGVTYPMFVANVVISTELFLLSRASLVILASLIVHGVFILLCVAEPRIFDLWFARLSKCPRIKNYRVWGCNSYRP